MKSDSELAVVSDDERGRDFLRFMSRHFVALWMEYQTFNDGKPFHRDVNYISGFVIQARDRHFWITAGHCLKELDALINKKAMEILESKFADVFGTEAKCQHFYPASYQPGCSFAIDDNEKALDFGAIPLGYLTLQNFLANGVAPISKENWVNSHKMEFECYRMLGIPSRPMRQLIMIRIDKVDPSEANESVPEGWFVGRLHPNVIIDSIEGMSGGPIYGFRRSPDGLWEYRVVALQSSWWPDSRIIKGCSMPFFDALLESRIESECEDNRDRE